MLACETLIAALVVARDPGHELLRVRFVTGLDLSEKVYGNAGPERRRHTSKVQDLHFPILSYSIGEAKVRAWAFADRCHGRTCSVRAASRAAEMAFSRVRPRSSMYAAASAARAGWMVMGSGIGVT